MSLADRLAEIQRIKQRCKNGTQSALTYLRIHEDSFVITEGVVEDLRAQGVSYVPSPTEVSNVCERTDLAIGYYFIIGRGGLDALGIERFEGIVFPFNPSFRHLRRIKQLRPEPISDLEKVTVLELHYQRINTEFFTEYSSTGNSAIAFRNVVARMIAEDQTPYAVNAYTHQPFYFSSQRALHETLLRASHSPTWEQRESGNDEFIRQDAEIVEHFYQGLSGDIPVERTIFNFTEAQLKGASHEARAFLFGKPGHITGTDCYSRALREGTLHQLEIQRIIALHYCRGNWLSSSADAARSLTEDIEEKQKALHDAQQRLEIGDIFNQTAPYWNLEDLDPKERAERVIREHERELKRYQDILWCVNSNRKWLDQELTMYSQR